MAVRGGGSAVEPTCFEKDEGTGAWGADPPVSPQSQAQKFNHARRQRSNHVTAADNQCVEIRIAERLRRDAERRVGRTQDASSSSLLTSPRRRAARHRLWSRQ